ncbi:MAG: hypothetical protein KA144_07460 [Xanthomonadaceae bacterium]|nr:hypothetical protein [Xanthomonadaceae bacterium]
MSTQHSTRTLIDRREWSDPTNWSRRSSFGVYFSKRDSRVWVPKAQPSRGWTLNFAHPAALVHFAALTAVAAAIVVSALVAL